ncbi:MAG: hypothetical protein O3A76_10860 [Chloroflexi bacterium]|nr:hypothetical protein [Chloroflexota bacterium]
MPRRPNFNYERQQRDRAKVAKREAKREARTARKDGDPLDEAATEGTTDAEDLTAALAAIAPDPDAATDTED